VQFDLTAHTIQELNTGNDEKKDLFLGFILGFVTQLGSYIFITLFTDFTFTAGIQIMHSQGKLSKTFNHFDTNNFRVLLKLNRKQWQRCLAA
jgi:hypothetical protein